MNYPPISRETLLALQAGNEQAFDAIYRQYYKALCAYASNYAPDVECEEIVQDVMMWLWENRQTISSEITLKSLLFTITKNKCLNMIAHLQVRQRVHEHLYEKFATQFEDPDFYLYGELMEKLEQALQKLPEDYRNAFEMNRFDDLTYKEIADKLGVSEKTIAYRISQALKILRKELKDYFLIIISFCTFA